MRSLASLLMEGRCRVPGVHWPATQANWWAPDSVRDFVSKMKMVHHRGKLMSTSSFPQTQGYAYKHVHTSHTPTDNLCFFLTACHSLLWSWDEPVGKKYYEHSMMSTLVKRLWIFFKHILIVLRLLSVGASQSICMVAFSSPSSGQQPKQQFLGCHYIQAENSWMAV